MDLNTVFLGMSSSPHTSVHGNDMAPVIDMENHPPEESRSGAPGTSSKFRPSDYSVLPYLINTTVLLAGAGIVTLLYPYIPHPDNSFLERDPALSLPCDDTISTEFNLVLSGLVPGTIMVGSILCVHLCYYGWNCFSWTVFIKSALPIVCTLMSTLGMTGIEVHIIKLLVGSKRPCFFDMCDYKGYREALQSGNFTSYWEKTSPDSFGDAKFCEAGKMDVVTSMESFVSGHAATSFCGLVCLSSWIYYSLSVGLPSKGRIYTDNDGERPIKFYCRAKRAICRWQWNQLAILFLCSLPISLATFISASRVHDNKHRTTDIGVGAVLGTLNTIVLFNYWILGDGMRIYYTEDFELVVRREMFEQENEKYKPPTSFFLGCPPRKRGPEP